MLRFKFFIAFTLLVFSAVAQIKPPLFKLSGVEVNTTRGFTPIQSSLNSFKANNLHGIIPNGFVFYNDSNFTRKTTFPDTTQPGYVAVADKKCSSSSSQTIANVLFKIRWRKTEYYPWSFVYLGLGHQSHNLYNGQFERYQYVGSDTVGTANFNNTPTPIVAHTVNYNASQTGVTTQEAVANVGIKFINAYHLFSFNTNIGVTVGYIYKGVFDGALVKYTKVYNLTGYNNLTTGTNYTALAATPYRRNFSGGITIKPYWTAGLSVNLIREAKRVNKMLAVFWNFSTSADVVKLRKSAPSVNTTFGVNMGIIYVFNNQFSG